MWIFYKVVKVGEKVENVKKGDIVAEWVKVKNDGPYPSNYAGPIVLSKKEFEDGIDPDSKSDKYWWGIVTDRKDLIGNGICEEEAILVKRILPSPAQIQREKSRPRYFLYQRDIDDGHGIQNVIVRRDGTVVLQWLESKTAGSYTGKGNPEWIGKNIKNIKAKLKKIRECDVDIIQTIIKTRDFTAGGEGGKR